MQGKHAPIRRRDLGKVKLLNEVPVSEPEKAYIA